MLELLNQTMKPDFKRRVFKWLQEDWSWRKVLYLRNEENSKRSKIQDNSVVITNGLFKHNLAITNDDKLAPSLNKAIQRQK